MSDQPISTFSLESEDLLSPHNGPNSEPSLFASPTPVVGSFLQSDGDCPSNRTLENSTAGDTQASLFSLEGHPVSRPVVPGSREARQMTAGSGWKLCACLTKQSRIASFSRILLASETWRSSEYFLRWEGMGLPSEISETLLIVEEPESLTKSWATLKKSVTKRSRSIFRLVPWTARNSGTDTGLSGSWQTPRADDPGCHNGKQDALPGQMKQTWPTVTESVAKAGCVQRAKDRRDELLLGGLVSKTTWPTPNASDGSGGAQSPDKRKAGNHSVQLPDCIGQTPYGCLARTESFVERLTTLSTWLMGYTGVYLALWETRSCRRKPTKSSKSSDPF